MATLRELKGRIGSVASSEKITGAMKMISSAKMHQAEGALRRLVPFRGQIRTILGNLLSTDAQFASPLVNKPAETKKVTIMVWGSDDGLCGGYNVNIYKYLAAYIDEQRTQLPANVEFTIVPVGKKIAKAVQKLAAADVKVNATPEGINAKSEGEKVNALMRTIQNDFLAGGTQRVDAVYMNFITAGRQRPRVEQLLPVLPEKLVDEHTAQGRPCLFEPDANSIFNAILPMFLMSTMQDIFCQNRASEQAARVMAMQSANDNAKSLLEQLQLEYNKLRQQSITSELLDIVGGQVRD